MDFRYTTEQEMYRQAIREWLVKNLEPRARGARAYAADAAHMTAAGRRLRPLRYRSWTPSVRFGVPWGSSSFPGTSEGRAGPAAPRLLRPLRPWQATRS